MQDLFLYLGIMVVGYIIGQKNSEHREKLRWAGKSQIIFLFALVLMMGMKMGANREITENLSTIGVTALIFTVVVLIFTVAGTYLTRRLLGFDKYGRMKPDAEPSAARTASSPAADAETSASITRMTLLIVLAVAGGMAIGYLVIRRIFADNMPLFDRGIARGIKLGLCLLLLFVGMDLGLDGGMVRNFKKAGWRIFIFPVVVGISTLLASVAAGPLLGFSLRESLAIGAGFGWYTLAPGIIIESGLVMAGAVSFLHNVLRELLSVLLIPIVAKKIGYIEVTGMAAAASMDVCLPLIEKSTRPDITIYAFASGALLSAAVPVLVPLILG